MEKEKTLNERAKALSKAEVIKVDLEEFRNKLKFYLCDREYLERAIDDTIQARDKSFDKETSYFLSADDEKAFITNFKEGLLNYTLKDENDALTEYKKIIDLLVDTREYDINETCLIVCVCHVLELEIFCELELEIILDLTREYLGSERAEFVSGVFVYADEIDKRKIPKWIYKNYGYLVNECIRLLERANEVLRIANQLAIEMQDYKPNEEEQATKETQQQEQEQQLEEKEEEKHDFYFFFNDEKKKPKEKYEFIPLPLEYNDTTFITLNRFSNNLTFDLVNELGIDERIAKQKYKVDLASIEKSEEILNTKLTAQDLDVLETILFDIYGAQHKTEFSDRQIAIILCKRNGQQSVSEDMLKKINSSIDKIQNVRISYEYLSEQEIDKLKARVIEDNPLLWLRKIRIEHKTSTTFYRIVGGERETPFYYEYAVKTGKVKPIDRQILYSNKKGIENNLDNTAVLRYLARRIEQLEDLGQIIINYNDIYEIYGATKSNYEGRNTALRKDKQRARDRAYNLLKYLQAKYKEQETPINFRINKLDKNSNRDKGLILTKLNKSV